MIGYMNYLYLAESQKHTIVKVGWTTKPINRISGLSAAFIGYFGEHVKLLGFREGGWAEEAALLKSIKQRQHPAMGREWFPWSQWLISWLLPQFPIPPSQAGCLCPHDSHKPSCKQCDMDRMLKYMPIQVCRFDRRWGQSANMCHGCKGQIDYGAWALYGYHTFHEWCLSGETRQQCKERLGLTDSGAAMRWDRNPKRGRRMAA